MNNPSLTIETQKTPLGSGVAFHDTRQDHPGLFNKIIVNGFGEDRETFPGPATKNLVVSFWLGKIAEW